MFFYFFDIFLSIPHWKLNKKLPRGVQSFFVQHFIFSPANFKVDMSDTWTGQKPYLAQGVNFKPSLVFFIDHRKYGPTLTHHHLWTISRTPWVRFDAEECNRSELEKFPKTLESQLNLLTEFKMQLSSFSPGVSFWILNTAQNALLDKQRLFGGWILSDW